jgi:hypothetical protein
VAREAFQSRPSGISQSGQKRTFAHDRHKPLTVTRKKLPAIVVYLMLATFYAGSLLLTFITLGFENVGAALALPSFLYSVGSRLVGGITCAAIAGMLYSQATSRTVAPLAWGLAIAVAGVLLLDVFKLEASSVFLWSIALGMVAVHVRGAIWVQSVVLEPSR